MKVRDSADRKVLGWEPSAPIDAITMLFGAKTKEMFFGASSNQGTFLDADTWVGSLAMIHIKLGPNVWPTAHINRQVWL